MTPQQSFDGQQAAATNAVPGNRLVGVRRAGRVEAAVPAEKRTDVAPIRTDHPPECGAEALGHRLHVNGHGFSPQRHGARFAKAANSQSASARHTAGSPIATRTTISMAGRAGLRRKDSRTTRLARLRPTACLISRLATTMPMRGTPTALGRATRRRGPRVKRTLGRRNTPSKSRRLRSRCPRPSLARPMDTSGDLTRRSCEPTNSQGRGPVALTRGVVPVKPWRATSRRGRYTARRLRPLARRALKILRPFFVAIRDRKPCRRLRRITLG